MPVTIWAWPIRCARWSSMPTRCWVARPGWAHRRRRSPRSRRAGSRGRLNCSARCGTGRGSTTANGPAPTTRSTTPTPPRSAWPSWTQTRCAACPTSSAWASARSNWTPPRPARHRRQRPLPRRLHLRTSAGGTAGGRLAEIRAWRDDDGNGDEILVIDVGDTALSGGGCGEGTAWPSIAWHWFPVRSQVGFPGMHPYPDCSVLGRGEPSDGTVRRHWEDSTFIGSVATGYDDLAPEAVRDLPATGAGAAALALVALLAALGVGTGRPRARAVR